MGFSAAYILATSVLELYAQPGPAAWTNQHVAMSTSQAIKLDLVAAMVGTSVIQELPVRAGWLVMRYCMVTTLMLFGRLEEGISARHQGFTIICAEECVLAKTIRLVIRFV